MTPQQQIEVYEKLDEQILSITKSKREDYAGKDVLSNFKGVSGAAKALGVDVTTPAGYSMFMVLLKIARLSNLLNAGKTPNHESVDDSFFDAINYMKLSYCCYLDSKGDEMPVKSGNNYYMTHTLPSKPDNVVK